jgi:glutamate dehydrogenase/leucine dehydrogenase
MKVACRIAAIVFVGTFLVTAGVVIYSAIQTNQMFDQTNAAMDQVDADRRKYLETIHRLHIQQAEDSARERREIEEAMK